MRKACCTQRATVTPCHELEVAGKAHVQAGMRMSEKRRRQARSNTGHTAAVPSAWPSAWHLACSWTLAHIRVCSVTKAHQALEVVEADRPRAVAVVQLDHRRADLEREVELAVPCRSSEAFARPLLEDLDKAEFVICTRRQQVVAAANGCRRQNLRAGGPSTRLNQALHSSQQRDRKQNERALSHRRARVADDLAGGLHRRANAMVAFPSRTERGLELFRVHLAAAVHVHRLPPLCAHRTAAV